ncbi:PAS domain S-box protein [Methanoregula sp.]|uniref:PAS domain S-box protein n=1 Tax=Methanoregula sp. TaxID=2052170 RepID=UPI002B54974F|nr:PAS domain S-box protein [Methanoregula sp.]HVP97332.1 PAS domain S-box protein [Methanoregula sp.]
MTGQPSHVGEREESFVDLWLFIIVATTILAIFINILAFKYGTAAVAANLLYIPIVLAAYWYPRWGISYAIGISALFIGVVAFVTGGAIAELTASFVTCLVVIGVAAVVSSLAIHMRRNEVKYRGIFNHSEAGIGLVNSSDRVIKEVNLRFAEMLGYEPSSMESLLFYRVWEDESDRDRFFQRLSTQGNVENLETRFVTKAGATRWVLLSAGMLPDDQFVCTIVDITARKQAEEELIIKDHAIRSSLNAISIMDLDFSITYVNHSLVSMMGFPEGHELSGTPFWKYVAFPQGIESIKDALSRRGSWLGEILLYKADQTPFYVMLWINLVKNDTGQPVCFMASFIDISDRKQMESVKRKALEQIEKNIEQFAILGDHIRNPLAVIVGLSSLAPGDVTDKIILQAREIDRIVTQLDMGWIESEKVREFIKRYYMVGAQDASESGGAQGGVVR